MRENKLTVRINKLVKIVFDFTLNPANTPRWIESIEEEETNEWPPKLKTIYKNRGVAGIWSEYIVSAFEPNKAFEFVAKDGNYHVRYTFVELDSGDTKMEYLEWVDREELENPFTQDILEKLKSVIENQK